MPQRKKESAELPEVGTLPKERVTIFGDEMDDRMGRHRHDGGSFFGIIFIGTGILLLLNTLNAVSWKVWDYIWRFWPFILILWGIQVILGFNFFSRIFLGFLSIVIVLFIILFAVHQVNPALVSGLPPVMYQTFSLMKGVQK